MSFRSTQTIAARACRPHQAAWAASMARLASMDRAWRNPNTPGTNQLCASSWPPRVKMGLDRSQHERRMRRGDELHIRLRAGQAVHQAFPRILGGCVPSPWSSVSCMGLQHGMP